MATTRYTALLEERDRLTAEGEAVFKAAEEAGRSLTAEERAADDQRDARLREIAAETSLEERRRARLMTSGGGAPTISGGHDRAADKPWASMGEFLVAVAAAGSPGGFTDPRLFQSAAPSGASSGVPSDGGFLVRSDYSTALLGRAIETARIAPLCLSIPIGEGSDGLEAPYIAETSRATGSRWGGVQVYRRGEADTVSATRPKLDLFDLRLEDLMGLAYGTERLLRDAQQMEAIFSYGFTSEFAFKVDDEIVRGSGAGQCLGVTTCSALVTIAKEAGQAAATVQMENLSNMWARLPARSRATAVWLINQDVEPQLDQLYIAAGLGGMDTRFITYGPEGVLRIKGRPVIVVEQCSTLGTVGDIILMDPKEYILITKGGIEAADSMHVRFLYNERTFRWVYRINGAPTWKTSVTPYKGSNAISPFVALATRA